MLKCESDIWFEEMLLLKSFVFQTFQLSGYMTDVFFPKSVIIICSEGWD